MITTGEFPGDGKPKPVVFPDPAKASIKLGAFEAIRLEQLIELKLASGLSAEHRMLRDFSDVQSLIETLGLPADLSTQLDPSVRQEYRRLWNLAQRARGEQR